MEIEQIDDAYIKAIDQALQKLYEDLLKEIEQEQRNS